MILALAGGVGGAKLARGLADILSTDELTVVVNTGDDFVHLGLHIAPDLDTVMYTLADINNSDLGWGIAGETWNFMQALETLGGETWFRLGDRDLATHIERTQRLRSGESLSAVTLRLVRTPGRRTSRGADERRAGAHDRAHRRWRADVSGLFRAPAGRAGGDETGICRGRAGSDRRTVSERRWTTALWRRSSCVRRIPT